MRSNVKTVSILFLCFNLFNCYIEATQVDLADIRKDAYFGESSDKLVDQVINSNDFEYGIADSLYYYARAREFAKNANYQDGIRELDQALKYCYLDGDKAYILSFRALLHFFLIDIQSIHQVYAIDDYTKVYLFTKDLHALLNRAKVKVVIGDYQAALSDIENIIIQCEKMADKEVLTKHDFGKDSLNNISNAKSGFLNNYPYYLKAFILKGFIYSKFLYDYNSAIKYYNIGLNLSGKDCFKKDSLEYKTVMLTKEPRVLNNLAMAYLMGGNAQDYAFAIYLINCAEKQDPSNLIFKESELFYYVCSSDLSLSKKLYLEIIKRLKVSSKMANGLSDFISLIYDYDNKYITLKMVETLFVLSSAKIKLTDLMVTLLKMPDLVVAGYVAEEIKELQQESKLTGRNLRDNLFKKYQLKIDSLIIKKILNLPSLYSFLHGYSTKEYFAEIITMKVSLYSRKDIDKIDVGRFLNYIEKYYGRSFLNFFTRGVYIKLGINYHDLMKNVFNSIEIQKSEMKNSRDKLENLQKKVIKD